MKQLKIWGLALVGALAVTSVSAQTVEDVGQKMQEAGTLVNEKKIAEAIPALEEVIKMGQAVGPDAADIVTTAQGLLPKLYLQQGVNEARAQKMTEAIAALNKAADLADLYGDLMTVRQADNLISNLYMSEGAASFNNKDFTKALESFKKGQAKNPDNVQLAYFTAKSYAELGQLEEAVALYKDVIVKGTENTKFAKQATDAKADMNTYVLVAASEAAKAGKMDELVKYVELVPDNADAGLMVTQAANNRKMYDVVIARGPEAFEAQTDAAKKSEVAYLLGVAYQNKGNNAKSAEWLRKVTSGSNVSAAKALLTEVTK